MITDLASLGWDAERDAEFAPYTATGAIPGRVARPDRATHLVLTAHGAQLASVPPRLRMGVSDPSELPTVGDWVALRPGDPALVDAVLARRSAFVRGSAGLATTGQVLAANVDVVFLVTALHPTPNLNRLERFLALAWESGATPVVVLSKADLAEGLDQTVVEVRAAATGVDVVPVSALTGEGMDAVASYAGPGRTVALLGTSGAGKSTLVNSLVGAEVMVTHDIRADGKGRHTTTTRELIPLPGGGVLVDTPGLRGVLLWQAEQGVAEVFGDLDELAVGCRFTDCGHDGEPDCAIQTALEAGLLSPRRLDSWRRLQRELAFEARKHDARLRAAERKKWKAISKSFRDQPVRGR